MSGYALFYADFQLTIEFHSDLFYGIMNAMVKLANPWSAS